MTVSPVFSAHIHVSTREKLHRFLNELYEVSDVIPPNDEKDPYVALFTDNATIKMASTQAQGTEAIAEIRKGMWKAVTKRRHEVTNVAQVSDKVFLLNGTVEYTMINGKVLITEWAGHMIFADEIFTKLDFYQVYLDPSPTKAALE